jgi:hypothetical protein
LSKGGIYWKKWCFSVITGPSSLVCKATKSTKLTCSDSEWLELNDRLLCTSTSVCVSSDNTVSRGSILVFAFFVIYGLIDGISICARLGSSGISSKSSSVERWGENTRLKRLSVFSLMTLSYDAVLGSGSSKTCFLIWTNDDSLLGFGRWLSIAINSLVSLPWLLNSKGFVADLSSLPSETDRSPKFKGFLTGLTGMRYLEVIDLS